jgi:hypothetical protein
MSCCWARCFVLGVAADVEQSAVNFRVQCLYATIHHFREAGVFADVFDREAGIPQGFGRATRGDQFHARGGEQFERTSTSPVLSETESRAREILFIAAIFHSPQAPSEKVVVGDWIRTSEGVSQQIYSLPPLATWVSYQPSRCGAWIKPQGGTIVNLRSGVTLRKFSF